jgi:hypothetical protein
MKIFFGNVPLPCNHTNINLRIFSKYDSFSVYKTKQYFTTLITSLHNIGSICTLQHWQHEFTAYITYISNVP